MFVSGLGCFGWHRVDHFSTPLHEWALPGRVGRPFLARRFSVPSFTGLEITNCAGNVIIVFVVLLCSMVTLLVSPSIPPVTFM